MAPVVWRDGLVWVKHVIDRPMPITLGHLIVETNRHAPYVDSLTDQEAVAVGLAVRNAARALRRELEVDAVHAYISNARMEHFHEHVIARHRGTPFEYAWHDVESWPEGLRGCVAEVTDLCNRLAQHFP